MTRRAAPPGCRDERALLLITRVDLPRNRRDPSTFTDGIGFGLLCVALTARLPADREALLLQFSFIRRQTALHQAQQIAVRLPMRCQPTHPLEQLQKLTICRKMQTKAA